MSEIEAFPSREALYEAAAGALSDALTVGIAAKGAASLALAGGSTPAPVYRLLSQAPLDWAKVTVTLTDERKVAADHPDSNERMLRQTLLTGPAAQARFAPLDETAIAALTPFDGVLLGMGEDGHFASLFPGNAALADGLAGGSLTIDVPRGEPAPPQPRSSLTLKALSGAATALLVITGAAKRSLLENVDGLPVAALIDAVQPRILWAD
jgi:6-phosphogluconolactonase